MMKTKSIRNVEPDKSSYYRVFRQQSVLLNIPSVTTFYDEYINFCGYYALYNQALNNRVYQIFRFNTRAYALINRWPVAHFTNKA